MAPMTAELRTLAAFGAGDQVLTGIVVASLLALLVLAGCAAWRALRRFPADVPLTVLAATLTSAVVATGMWHFAGERLHFSGLERVLLFAILEVTVLTCAVRARRNILEAGTAGPEGVAIWAVSLMSGAFAATATTSAPEAAFRLTLPLLATWLWERSLLPARRASGKRGRWQVAAERVLARLGIGALDLTADEDAAAKWRIAQLARAVVRAKRGGRLTGRWHRWRVNVLTVAANERAELAIRADRRDLLLAYIGVLHATDALIAVTPPAPWGDAKQNANYDANSGGDERQGERQDKRRMNATERAKAHAKARRLLSANWSMPIADVASQTGLSPRTVDRIKAKMPTPIGAARTG